MSITTTEREKYNTLAEAVPKYAEFSPAEKYLPVFLELQRADDTFAPTTVLDAGCCTGKGGLWLREKGFAVTLADLTDAHLVEEARTLPFEEACLWHDLSAVARMKGHPGRTKFDYTVCCDVLEHIPTEFTMLVIRNLLAITTHGLFLSISLVPDGFGQMIGERLHATVQSYTWWRDHLKEMGELVEARDLLNVGLYYVRPR